jgi:hypothetical protein
MGMGRRAAPLPTPAASPPASAPAASGEEEIAALKEMAGELQRQLAEVMERLDRLQEEE